MIRNELLCLVDLRLPQKFDSEFFLMLNFLNGVVNGSLGFEIGTSELIQGIKTFIGLIFLMILMFRVGFIMIINITARSKGLINFLIECIFLKHHFHELRILIRYPLVCLRVVPIPIRSIPVRNGWKNLLVLGKLLLHF
jgi:hypothetical protein